MERCSTPPDCLARRPHLADVEEAQAMLGDEPPQGMRERDWQVLKEVAEAVDGQVGFQGIKRRLDLHPEALRRTLRRLVADGLVARGPLGYALTEAGLQQVAGRLPERSPVRVMPLAFLLLPTHLTADRVVAAFARRWFDGLHWYGVQEGSGETALTWLTADGARVRLRVGPWGLRIESAAGAAFADEHLVAAAPLVAAVADLLRAMPAAHDAPVPGPTATDAGFAS